MDAWAQIALWCHNFLQCHKWSNINGSMHLLPSSELHQHPYIFDHLWHRKKLWHHNAICAQASIKRFLRSNYEVIQGKLDGEILVPYFLADPSHCMKVVAKCIFSILNDGKDQKYGYTKEYSIRLKKDWEYTIKKNRNKSLYELQQASKVPLKYMFKNHGNCSAEWCFNKRGPEEVNEYNYK